MPVFEQSYPRWSPTERTRVRWLPIVRRELEMLLAQRAFKALLVVCALPALFHLLQLYSVHELAADPQGELGRALRHIQLTIDARFFFQFLQLQTYFVFVLLLYASSGLVCDDIRLNLAEVYFSKPLTRRDYILGKVVTVLGLGLLYTVIPALFLWVAHHAMSPASPVEWRIPLASALFSLVIVVPTGLGTLACSALTASRGFAAAAVIALLAADAFVASLLAEILTRREVHLVNLAAAIERVGEGLFGVERYIPVAAPLALVVPLAVAAGGLLVLRRRIGAVEVGAR